MQKITCPWCRTKDIEMDHVGSVGVTLHDGGDAQADRFDCPNGHTALVITTPDEEEG
jgi:hypothetical protein